MSRHLNSNTTVHVLAADLGLGASRNPVQQVVSYCQKRVNGFLSDFAECPTPASLLSLAANKLGTILIEVHSDSDLRRCVEDYVARGELAFATLEPELGSDALGITLRLLRRGQFDLPYVSVIDCRGSKERRAYFTKWHEIGHLLILTDQRRLSFKRTHSLHEPKSAEESLVDVIAGEFAYYGPMVRRLATGEISFEAVDMIRRELSPEGSFTSALIGIVKAWPRPCALVEARMALKAGDGDENQNVLAFCERPVEKLRAVSVTMSEPARARGIRVHRNFRVPPQSIIWRVHAGEAMSGEAYENLNWWRASDGTHLQNVPVVVRAQWVGDSVHCLIVPTK